MDINFDPDTQKAATAEHMIDNYKEYKNLFGDIHTEVKHPDIDNEGLDDLDYANEEFESFIEHLPKRLYEPFEQRKNDPNKLVTPYIGVLPIVTVK